MVLRIICGILVILAAGAFALFVVASLREINSKIDSIPKHHWGMGVYMDNIPQNEQNTSRLVSVPLKYTTRVNIQTFQFLARVKKSAVFMILVKIGLR